VGYQLQRKSGSAVLPLDKTGTRVPGLFMAGR
jgi:hypothetical protein